MKSIAITPERQAYFWLEPMTTPKEYTLTESSYKRLVDVANSDAVQVYHYIEDGKLCIEISRRTA